MNDEQQADEQNEEQADEKTDGTLTGHDIAAELLEDWRILLGALHARFRTGDFATGLRLVNDIGAAAEAMNHHPDVTLTYPQVDVKLVSHDVGGLSSRDVELAREISRLAGSLGAAADPSAVSVLEIALDTPDHEAVRPFWAAVLGLDDAGGDEVVDGSGRLPSLWFQKSDGDGGSPVPQRFHVDIAVPPEIAERRVRAAVEAGGTLVSDGRAPSFWVLADSDGNKACVCTWLGRD